MSDELKKRIKDIKVIYIENMRDYSKDPYFRKKHEEMKAFLEKHPLPEELKKKK
jgi:hypothetical protein